MPPWLVLALLISLLAALGYQIVMTHSLKRVPIYWIAILAGFLIAEGLSDSAHLNWVRLGELQIVPDLLAVILVLGLLRLARL